MAGKCPRAVKHGGENHDPRGRGPPPPNIFPPAVMKGKERPEGLPPLGGGRRESASESNLKKMTENFQANIIAKALERTRGNRTEAARILGLSRVGLYHQMKRLGMLKKEEC